MVSLRNTGNGFGDSMKDQVRPLWGGLKFLRAHPHGFCEKEVRNFRLVTCDAGIIISLAHHLDSRIAGLVENFEMIVLEMKEEVSRGFVTEGIRDLQVETSQIMPEIPAQINFPAADKVVGFQEDEIRSILGRLTGGPKHLTVTPIVGMAGLGKTTFALQLYNHPSLIHYFQLRVSFSVTQVYSRHKLCLDFLNQIHPDMSSRCAQMTEDDLADMLYRTLKGKRYLVFLDDVWDQRVWLTIRMCFPDGHTGSRILLTSRDIDIIYHSSSEEGPYLLRLRRYVESLEILRTKLFPEGDFPVVLRYFGIRIAESCKGLPMTIIAVVGLLNTPKPGVWKKVLESLKSNTLSTTEQFINSSELSYRYLPNHLKLCFLSFGLFPGKEEVSAEWLYRLWIAEGLIQETQWNKMEDVAMQYMSDLVNKSLVIVTKTTSLGAIKTCRVHESIRRFCIRKFEVENFSQFLKGYGNILAVNDLCGSKRLCIQSSRRDFKSLRLSRPDIHSLIFLPLKDTWPPRVVDDVSFIVRVFKSLRVLHIRHIDLGEVFPVEMKLLVELRYLAVRGHFADIPSSIGYLSNLQTLIVDSRMQITLPATIWDLYKLRHLCIENGFHFHFDNLEDSSILFQLESCSGVIAEPWDIFMKFPNVSKLKLKCSLLDFIIETDYLHRLESLHVSSAGVMQHCHEVELNYASQLQSLTLKGLVLSESLISSVGKLPRLKSLKLLHISFPGGGLHMEEEDFQRLKYFKLSNSNILRWTAPSDFQLPNLEKLVLQGCMCLVEIPSNLEYCPTLERIELLDCSSLVESLVKDIAEVQKDFGNYVSISITPSSEKDFQ